MIYIFKKNDTSSVRTLYYYQTMIKIIYISIKAKVFIKKKTKKKLIILLICKLISTKLPFSM